MAKLIDADKLESGEVIIPTENGGYEYVEVFYKDDVDNAPSVDAVEVVRCKDCRYYHVYYESNGHAEKGYGACDWINDKSVREDHFCSWGERREDDSK